MFAVRLISMPIFSKVVASSPVRAARLRRISNTQARLCSGAKSRLVRKPSSNWALAKAGFAVIDYHLHGQLSKTIKDFFSVRPEQKMFVLDWGCYDGLAAKQLAQDSRLSVFGFSRDAHLSMLSPGNATFLNTEKPHLVRYLKKHKIKFDLVYSRMGLSYLSSEELGSHLIELKECVNVGGKIFTGVSWLNRYPEKIKELCKAGYEPTYDSNGLLCLTRVK